MWKTEEGGEEKGRVVSKEKVVSVGWKERGRRKQGTKKKE